MSDERRPTHEVLLAQAEALATIEREPYVVADYHGRYAVISRALYRHMRRALIDVVELYDTENGLTVWGRIHWGRAL